MSEEPDIGKNIVDGCAPRSAREVRRRRQRKPRKAAKNPVLSADPHIAATPVDEHAPSKTRPADR